MEIIRNRYLSKLISKMNNGLVKKIMSINRCEKVHFFKKFFTDI